LRHKILWFLGQQFDFCLHWSCKEEGLHVKLIMIMHLH